ncbi:hypothetical protein [Pontibacter sp. 172403-2]|nr:hypothetical protein [Pontibacter sp. 172403-2]
MKGILELTGQPKQHIQQTLTSRSSAAVPLALQLGSISMASLKIG